MGKKKANKGESEVLDTKPAPRGLTLASFLAFPSLGEAPTPNASAPSYCAADPLAIPSSSASCEVASEQHDGLGPKVLAQAPASTWQPKCSGITAKTAATSQTSKTVSISQATKGAHYDSVNPVLLGSRCSYRTKSIHFDYCTYTRGIRTTSRNFCD